MPKPRATIPPSTPPSQETPRSQLPDDVSANPAAFDLLDDSLGYALKRANIRAYNLLFTLLGHEELTPGRMTALSIIGSNPGISQTMLAQQLGITRGSVVKVVDSLEQLDLIERQAVANDRRSYSLKLTAAGYEKSASLRKQITVFENALTANLSKEERATLMHLLEKVGI